MADRADVLLGGLKRLQRELDYYKDELDKLHKRMDTSKDEYEVKKIEEMISETNAVMHSTRDKMQAFTSELLEMGIDVTTGEWRV